MADLRPVSGRLPRRIAFTDLAAQQAVIRADIDRAMARVLDAGSYILGEDVGVLERGSPPFPVRAIAFPARMERTRCNWC